VWKNIIGFLIEFHPGERRFMKSQGRKALSQLSRVCRELATTLRPLLFDRLHLNCPSDISFLQEIFKSTTSGWLASHIHRITSHYKDSIFPTSTLFPCLSSVQTISYQPDAEVSTLPLEMRPRLSRLHSLRSLELRRLRFPSFSVFLRLVGAIPSLEELRLVRIDWRSICDPDWDQLPDCKVGFHNLKFVGCDGGFSTWPVAWMFVAAATGYTYRQHKVIARNPDLGVPPVDICVLVRIVKMALTHLDPWGISIFALRECPDKGNVPYHALNTTMSTKLTIT
jgi:hypothetical protein